MNSDDAVQRQDTTVVADPLWVHILLWAGLPLLGVGAGWALSHLLEWATGQLPLPGPLRLLASLPQPHVTVATAVIGALAGLAVAHRSTQESLALTVTSQQATLRHRGTTQQVARGDVAAAFLDEGQLLLVDRDGHQLAGAPCESSHHANVARAFIHHSYPWHGDGDPYRSHYRRWVPDLPGLPHGADALLKARQQALEQDQHTDVTELRAELAKLGVVVRDRNRRQYWRRVDQGHP